MRALRYYGERDVRYEHMDDPTPQSDRDAIVKVDACSICGSDLHIYHGHGFSEDVGFCVGHEAVGEVVEIGRGVSRLKVGDKVMIPAAVGCGACRSCLSGVVGLCEFGLGSCYGLSGKLQGSQADAVRVPAADSNAVLIPDGVSAEQALMMTDALATAWFGARNADIKPGSSVAVIGLGPIGLMAVDSAFVMGAHVVYAIDPIKERRALAAESGAIALHPDDAMERIKQDSRGRKLDCVIEVVGQKPRWMSRFVWCARAVRCPLSASSKRGVSRSHWNVHSQLGLPFGRGHVRFRKNCQRFSPWSSRAVCVRKNISAIACR